MFTGLVEDVGRVRDITPCGNGVTFWVETALPIDEMSLGDSIACDGVCLTAEAFREGAFQVTAGIETLNCTTLGALEEGGALHLERALRVGDRMGGHMVSGHVERPCVVEESMGITFREAGNTAVVESLKPGGAAEGAVKPGDVLVRCDATVLEACDTPVTVGGPGVSTKHHRVKGFECLGAPFDTQMAALNSTGVVDAGYLHAKVRVEFQREVPEDAVGDLKRAGHPATSEDFDLRSNASSE